MTEHDLQASIVAECALRANQDHAYSMLFAVPNGGDRNVIVARKLKAEGVKRGVPDLVLPVARHGMHGLFLELKIRPNKPSKEQKAWAKHLIAEGYMVATVYDDPVEAMRLITWYVEGDR